MLPSLWLEQLCRLFSPDVRECVRVFFWSVDQSLAFWLGLEVVLQTFGHCAAYIHTSQTYTQVFQKHIRRQICLHFLAVDRGAYLYT